tara:strand:- start:234 stop:500 length:267 start_codon:yes stop_codon:yes gene_type:complete
VCGPGLEMLEIMMEDNNLTKKQKEELEKLQKEIVDEAKKVVENYVDNPSNISGSTINIHQNSPFLDTDENDEPRHSGSRWTKVIKTKI